LKKTDLARHSARPFEELSPDIILNSVESVIGARSTGNYWALNSVENRVLEIPFEDNRSFVAKFYRPGRWAPQTILEEHAFLKLLTAQEIPVNAPVVSMDCPLKSWGHTLFQTQSKDYQFSVFPKLRGRIKDEFTDTDFEILGRLLARIHLQGAAFPSKSRRVMNPDNWGLDSLDFLEDTNQHPSPMLQRYFQVAEECVEKIQTLWDDVQPREITIHGDCHIGNLLWNESGPVFLDFDDLVRGPCIQDFWMLIGDHDDENRQKWEIAIEAYEEFREFPKHETRLIPALRALRMIHFSKWIAERWEDPSFPSLWANFGTDPWWQDEIQSLSLISERLFE
jgi:Ser/Thr protein kinase RdoA (MazF antagonist)